MGFRYIRAIGLWVACSTICFASADPISEEQAVEFAGQLTAAVEAQDTAAVQSLLKLNLDLAGMLKGQEFHYQDKDAWVRTMQARVDMMDPVTQILFAGVEEVDTYKFTSTRLEDERRVVVMRLASDELAMTYHILTLERDADGRIVVTEFENPGALGDPLEFMKFVAVRYAPWESSDGAISAEAPNHELLRNEKRWGFEMIKQMKAGEYGDAVVTSINMPPSLRDNPHFVGLAVAAAEQLRFQAIREKKTKDLKQPQDVINNLLAKYPDNPTVAMFAIEGQIDQGEFEKATIAISTLRKKVGDDPLLRISEARVLAGQGQSDEAIKMASEALALVSYLPAAFVEAADVYVRVGDYAGAVKVLEQGRARHQVTPNVDAHTATHWANFLKSEEYRTWKDN